MELNRSEDRVWEPAPAENFTGNVWFGPLAPRPTEDSLSALGVHFEPGARTDWHTHPGGQTLYVTDGAGFVQRRGGESVRIGPGDVVYAPAGEEHWHGATPHSHMTHLSLTSHGVTQWLPEKVSDDDYGLAGQTD